MVLSPEKHYVPGTTEPVSSGLQTLSELLAWGRGAASPLDRATVPLAKRDPPLENSPHRTLVSHDMMGGYLDDRWDLTALNLRSGFTYKGFVKKINKLTFPQG